MTHTLGHRFEPGQAAGHGRLYQCVYCKHRFIDRTKLPAHDVQCDAKFIVRRMWALLIERARHREAAMGIARKDRRP